MKFSETVRHIRVLTPPLPWDRSLVNEKNNEEVVILLHGLWRSVKAMQPMADFLSELNYTTVNVCYSSFKYELDELVSKVNEEIKPWIKKGKKVHFVTHSLGGVVVKRLLEKLKREERERIGRVVMLAPPHRGSEIVDWLRSSPLSLVKGVLGPAGEFLSSSKMARQRKEFPRGVEAAVIMGDKSALPFFRKLLDASNDGVLSVEKGRLLGINEFKVVTADHTFISSKPEVMELTRHFIEFGSMKSINERF